MKFFSKKFALIEVLVVLAVIALAAVFFMPRARGQAYFTNSTPATGPQQYNQNFVNAANVQATINRQQATGLQGFTSAPGAGGYGGLQISNSFPAQIYTVAPVVTVSMTGVTGTNACCEVVAVTSSNVIIQASTTNSVTFNYIAIGH